jgi:hypothetical protein
VVRDFEAVLGELTGKSFGLETNEALYLLASPFTLGGGVFAFGMVFALIFAPVTRTPPPSRSAAITPRNLPPGIPAARPASRSVTTKTTAPT